MTSHKVLVIDDSMVIRRTVRDMLPQGKFDIIEAKDGVQGIDKINSENPNLIMLDFFLPRKSGLEVYQEIQNDEHLKMIPLLLMSGRKDEVTDKIPEPFEFFAFLEKPFDQKQLIQSIKDAMERSKKLAEYIKQSTSNEQEASNEEINTMKAQIQHLNTKVVKMDREILHLKKQVNQLVHFIKQKMR